MDTNKRILDSLSLRNSDLERCQDIFSSLWLKYNFQVKTFQEGLPLRLPTRLGQAKMVKVTIFMGLYLHLHIQCLGNKTDFPGDLKVVPDYSSCLGDSRERTETLEGDHRSMCRYAGTEDPNYKKVTAELCEIYNSCLEKAQVSQEAATNPPDPVPTALSITHDDQGMALKTDQ
jgi:protein SERAC1